MNRESRIFVAGHRGLVGSAITRHLVAEGCNNLLLRSRTELDLTARADVHQFFAKEKPEYVILAAAKVGGIQANQQYPADFISTNLLIQSNIIDACFQFGVQRLLFLGSSCIYPKLCPQPIREEYLLTGPLEPTNRPYAVAKIAGIEQCWAYNRQHGTKFLAAMPTNLYGPEDNFNLETSHVLPALMRKVAQAKAVGAKEISVWGTGTPRREFLYSDDLAEACVHLLRLPDAELAKLLTEDHAPMVNIGTGEDVTIRELADMMCRILEYDGALVFDASRPDGTPRKLLDVSRMTSLGWRAHTRLEDGLRQTYTQVKDRLLVPQD